MEQLAIFGGKPMRETPISYGRQFIDDADIQAVVEVLKSPWLTCGPQIPALEKKLCEITGAKYAVAVSNGTAALHIAAMAAGIGPGDEVIVSPITFAASANCVLYCGGMPVFADIDPETYNIDPKSIRERITEKTKALVVVDFTGQAADYDEILKICEEYGLILIEDAAHAIGTKYNGKGVGSYADLTTFSFHPVKTVTAGEGGAVTTNDEKLYRHLLRLRSHGITRNQDEMVNESHGPWYNEQVELGYNYRLTDIQAALVSSQLDKLHQFVARRKEIVAKYDEAFAQIPELIVQKEIPASDTARHLYILHLNPETAKCTRREMYDALYAENVCTQVHYLPVYWHSHYEKLGYEKGLCPNAESLYEHEMSLPLFYTMTDEDVESVIAAVKKVLYFYR